MMEPRQPAARRAPRVTLPNEEPSPEETDAWVFTYMDVITLLVTLFVVLLSFATFSEPAEPGTTETPSTAAAAAGRSAESPQQPRDVDPELQRATEAIQVILAGIDGSDDIRVAQQQERTAIRFGEHLLFPEGSAQLTDPGRALISRFLPILRTTGLRVVVEGHTDPTPIATQRFPSNWELSALRATTVLRLLQRNGVPSERLSIRAYADTRPVADNATAAGRARNRRVTLVLQSAGADGAKRDG